MEVYLEVILGIVSRIGHWLDSRFPEKISAEEVMKSLQAYARLDGEMASLQMRVDQILQKLTAFETGARAFDKDLREVKDDMNKLKSVMAVMTRTTNKPVLSTSEPWKR
jgi:hypothetical protein